MTETSKAPTDAEIMARYEIAEHERALRMLAAVNADRAARRAARRTTPKTRTRKAA